MPKAQCIADGCERPSLARGYCSRHYYHIRKHGRVLPDSKPCLSADKRVEQAQAIQRSLEVAKRMYARVFGMEGRLRWRQEIASLESELAELTGSEERAVAFSHTSDSSDAGA